MPLEVIREFEEKMKGADYIPNTTQKRLAEEITRIVHGEDGLSTALRVTEGAAPGSKTTLDAQILESIAQDMPSHTMAAGDVIGQKIVDVMVKVGLQPSKSDARRLIRNGGVYLNNEKLLDENSSIIQQNLIDGRLLLLAAGKKNKILIRVDI